MRILMMAAENGALPGGKVGGIGDVVRDVPVALAERGCSVTVLTPAYGRFASLPGAKKINQLNISFGGSRHFFDLYELTAQSTVDDVRHVAVDHPMFSDQGGGRIYCSDSPNQPFATDAKKFALFCVCAAESIVNGVFGDLDVIHLHDWHAAMLLVLRRYHRNFQALRQIHCAFTIHNLALQGIRPFANDGSALEAWFPDLQYERKWLADPRWPDCINPMASAIRLADTVHAVSPSYAEEILSPGDPELGIHGGEGLEMDLLQAKSDGRLFGILNGCEYPPKRKPMINSWNALLNEMRQQQLIWAGEGVSVSSAHFIAHIKLNQLKRKRPGILLTSVGRITEQKIGLMLMPTSSGRTALECVLETLGNAGQLVMIGSGEPNSEQSLTRIAARFDNFIFLRGYSEEIGAALYHLGDLFFMPSVFEPCGISQMLAMRAGQPCLVHEVGGLKDTVTDNETGFVFGGNSSKSQADNLVATVERAIALFNDAPGKWKAMREAAAAQRFDWSTSVDAYINCLYK